MKEIWRSVVGYEGYYEVSNFGRVRSLPRNCTSGKILKPALLSIGYLRVNLCKDGKMKNFNIHRLVAQAFIPNPDNLPIVNHKDEVKTNNFVFVREDGSIDFNKSNLEWCDYKYNNNYGTHNERVTKAISKTVYQYTLDGEFVREWPSTAEVQRQTGWGQTHISACCLGKRKSAYNYKWSYNKQ